MVALSADALLEPPEETLLDREVISPQLREGETLKIPPSEQSPDEESLFSFGELPTGVKVFLAGLAIAQGLALPTALRSFARGQNGPGHDPDLIELIATDPQSTFNTIRIDQSDPLHPILILSEATSPVLHGQEPFFDPIDELSSAEIREFGKHYGIRDQGAIKDTVRAFCYGGESLSEVYSSIEVLASTENISNREVTIVLHPAPGSSLEPLVLRDISMKQFLVSGLKPAGQAEWDGADHWNELDTQQRLELAHGELARVSIVFQSEGAIQGDAQIQGAEQFSHIELVNNCTTNEGFEFKLRTPDGKLYHGSFGRGGGLDKIYTALSQQQAGSLPKQSEALGHDGATALFRTWAIKPGLYNYFSDQSSYSIEEALSHTPRIDLNRYRTVVHEHGPTSIRIDTGEIDYQRWGETAEYNTKPNIRRLVVSVEDAGGTRSTAPPSTYAEVRDAKEIQLAGFEPNGLYNVARPHSKTHYSDLYRMDQAIIRDLNDGRVEIEIQRNDTSEAAVKRIVIGNIDLEALEPEAPFTIDRFGYGSRPTTVNYDREFIPPGERDSPAHYAYILGGKGGPEEANRYVLPEGYGVERAILTLSKDRESLTIDLISFERILPVWRGTISLQQ